MPKHIFITGVPGVGKTTLIKKIVSNLKSKNIDVTGFYTEELRSAAGKRIGFDIVTLNGERSRLARSADAVPPTEGSNTKLGQYFVYTGDLEKIVVPIFKVKSSVLVIDEIGKMELFSELFKTAVKNAFERFDGIIMATIPIKRAGFTQNLVDNTTNLLFTVKPSNRDSLLEEVMRKIEL